MFAVLIEVLNVHKDAVLFLKRDVMSTHQEPPSCIGWVLVVRGDAAALGQAGLHILLYNFSEPQANWIVSAHPSL